MLKLVWLPENLFDYSADKQRIILIEFQTIHPETMGTKIALPYANIFMKYLKQEILDTVPKKPPKMT